MQVTERHIEQYREEGYCLIEGLISVELMGAVRQRVGEIVAERPDWPEQHFQVLDPGRYQSAKGEALPGGIQQPAEREEALRRFVALDEGEADAALAGDGRGDVCAVDGACRGRGGDRVSNAWGVATGDSASEVAGR